MSGVLSFSPLHFFSLRFFRAIRGYRLAPPMRHPFTQVMTRLVALRFSFLAPFVLGFSGMHAAGAILFDSLSAGSPNGSYGVSNTQWIAQSFSTTNESFILSDIRLRLWNQNGTSGNFEIQVWDVLGTSGSPGSKVGTTIYTGLAQNLSSEYGGLLEVSGLSVTLAPNTDYYLVAKGATLADIPDFDGDLPGFLYWDATDINTSATYDTTGSGWNGPSGQDMYMKVTAVPESSTYGLILGSISLAALRRRRKG